MFAKRNPYVPARKASRPVIAAMLNAADGKLVVLDYVKKDGTRRTVRGRLTDAAGDRELVCLWDFDRAGYRSISLDRIDSIVIKGALYRIAD